MRQPTAQSVEAEILAYVPGGLETIKEFLQPVKEAQKAHARKTLCQKPAKSYEVDGFGLCYFEDQRERIVFKISRKAGSKTYSINLQLEALH